MQYPGVQALIGQIWLLNAARIALTESLLYKFLVKYYLSSELIGS